MLQWIYKSKLHRIPLQLQSLFHDLLCKIPKCSIAFVGTDNKHRWFLCMQPLTLQSIVRKVLTNTEDLQQVTGKQLNWETRKVQNREGNVCIPVSLFLLVVPVSFPRLARGTNCVRSRHKHQQLLVLVGRRLAVWRRWREGGAVTKNERGKFKE